MEQIHKQILEQIQKHRSFVVASHISPEGDALGSALALNLILERMGKQVKVYNADPLPHFLKFLPAADRLLHDTDQLGDPQMIFVLDCGAIKRTGLKFNDFIAGRPVINIDHHATNEMFGKINLVKPKASSVGEVLYEMFLDLEIPMGPDVATNLYTAILTDTGSFRFPNTSPRTMRIAADLVELGADPAEIARAVYESVPASKLMLLARALATMQVSPDSERAQMMLTREMFEQTGTTAEAAEGFINYLSSIEGIKIAILIREMGQGVYKVSFRSPGKVDVAALAQTFGGGGHREAAGATIHGSLDEVRTKLYEKLDLMLGKDKKDG